MKRKGFTLVELLAVIAILAILVIIALPNVLKMFNDSKKNAFIVQARKTANVAQEKLFTSNEKSFDCNELLTGQKFKECTATTSNNKVSVDVLGSGTYENFLMIGVTNDANSGTFVDLSKLKVMDIEKPFKEDLIKDGKINSKFKVLTKDEYLTLLTRLGDSVSEEDLKAYEDGLKIIEVQNDKIVISSEDRFEYIIMIENLNKGKYSFKVNDNIDEILTESNIKACENDNSSKDCRNYDKYYEYDEYDGFTKILTIDVSDNDIIYLHYMINKNMPIENMVLEQISGENFVTLNSDKTVYLTPSDVLSYKDNGISHKNKTLSSANNEVFEYGKIDSKEGTYKYNYIVRTKDGYEKFTREIIVANYTSEKCFKFNTETQEIEQYYYFEDNKSGAKACPKGVIIPEKINNVQVKSIGRSAFKYSCSNIVLPTSVKSKYEIGKLSCKNYPIGITSVKLPDGLVSIGMSAFSGNKLKEVVIPKTVTYIDEDAFANNELQSVEFEGDKNNISIRCDAFYGEKHPADINNLSKDLCK